MGVSPDWRSILDLIIVPAEHYQVMVRYSRRSLPPGLCCRRAIKHPLLATGIIDKYCKPSY